jgi:hypothetical protein
LNQILRRQTSRSHYGSKVPAVTVTVFKYRNKIAYFAIFAGYIIKYMLSGCELIDTENISLSSQDMKFAGE